MSAKITDVRIDTFPALRFIGKPCMCAPADFIEKWNEWLINGWFEPLEKLSAAFENGDAYLGATSGDSYWIGLLFPAGTPVPNGYEYLDNPAAKYAVFRFDGKKDKELLSEDGITLVYEEMGKRGLIPDADVLCIERYNRPASEKNSKVLLECLHAIKE